MADVSNVDEEFEDEEYDPDEDDGEDTEEGSAEASSESKPKRNFVDLPEGHLTLVGFSKLLAKPVEEGGRNTVVKSQVLYSTAKNVKTFPVKTHSDGRQMVTTDEALAWWDAKEQRKADRAAASTASSDGEDSEAEGDDA